ncbi:FAD:protein FMN transferase [Deinococcus sonorensis]|uniref:FAD:protein FMN transferase n=2 Tax=Deinococcus sonorensis TaxID=309891 RepID=A0AAU7UG04_9DEIO
MTATPLAAVLRRVGRWLDERAGRPRWYTTHYERVLGTSLELRVRAETAVQAKVAEQALLDEIDRLEQVFSRFDPASELNRWQATLGVEQPVSPDLGELLAQSLDWTRETGGAYHPGADALGRVWAEAEQRGTVPDPAELEQLVNRLQAPAYRVRADRRAATRLSDLTLNFNAHAKGQIVDRAAEAAYRQPGVRAVLVNIGGDLRHLGDDHLRVAVADPLTRADNAPPAAHLQISGQGVATSGDTWRGYTIRGERHSHVLDPRSGQPVTWVVGASVLARDSATADVLATAFSVLTPEESLRLADQLTGVGCLLVTRDRQRYSNRYWQQHSG